MNLWHCSNRAGCALSATSQYAAMSRRLSLSNTTRPTTRDRAPNTGAICRASSNSEQEENGSVRVTVLFFIYLRLLATNPLTLGAARCKRGKAKTMLQSTLVEKPFKRLFSKGEQVLALTFTITLLALSA